MYVYTYIHTWMTYIHVHYIHTYIHVHTYIHTRNATIHTCTHTYTHVHVHSLHCSPACLAFFLSTAALIIANNSSSVCPALRASRRDTSEFPNKHTYTQRGQHTVSHLVPVSSHAVPQTLRLPSAVMRSRLQEPQKCSLMEVMKPTWPA